MLCVSNPLRIAADTPLRSYWCDLHGQSEETIGTNSARDLIEFARDRAFLDGMSHQGNDFQITTAFWNELNDLTREYNADGSFVIFPGYVDWDDLPVFYNAAEVFVFPSIFEGFGLPVLESMASGMPAITSFGSSLEEVAGDGALLVDPLDVRSIANAIAQVLEDAELRNQLITRGLRRSSEFTVEKFAGKILEVYGTLNRGS